MKKKGIWVLVSVLVVLGLLMGGFGCAAPTPTPTPTPAPTPTPTPTPAPAPSPEVITLKWHNPFPPAGLNLAERWWMDEVERQTEGRVVFDRIFGGALGTLDEQPMAIKAGSFDLGQVSCVYNPGAYPRSSVVFMPFTTENVLAQHVVGHQLYNSDLVKMEYAALNQVFLMNGMWAQLQLMSYDPVYTIDDLRQIKIRSHGGAADALDAMGITTYGIPWEEYPAAAERRVVDAGIQGTPTDAHDFGFSDIYSYWTPLVFYYFPMTLVMNMDTFNGLPADIQQTMENISNFMMIQTYTLYHETEVVAEYEMLTEKGIEKIPFQEVEELKAAGGPPAWAAWVADRDAEDIDGQAILDWYFDRLAFYGG